MDRKWRTNRGAVDTVQPLPTFRASLGIWKSEYQLATLTDLYAAYTVLHIEDKECTLMWSEEAGFYYFLTRQTIDGESPSVAAPEGDEDPPLVSASACSCFRHMCLYFGVHAVVQLYPHRSLHCCRLT